MKTYKKVLQKIENDTICDIYPKEPTIFKRPANKTNACAKLRLSFWWGSQHDGTELNLDLSDKASNEILILLMQKYGVDKINKHLTDYLMV